MTGIWCLSINKKDTIPWRLKPSKLGNNWLAGKLSALLFILTGGLKKKKKKSRCKNLFSIHDSLLLSSVSPKKQ